MSSYSKSKVSAFFGSHHDNSLRESIRQDVLIERYDDLQKEISHIEDLLNISENHFNDDLFIINEILFEMLEALVPELIEEEEEEIKEDHNCEAVHPGETHNEWEENAKTDEAADDPETRRVAPSAVDPKSGRGSAAGTAKDADAKRKQRVAAIKDREQKAIGISRDKETMIRAKSLIRTAQQTAKGADNPESKKRAQRSLNRARQQMTRIGKDKK